MGRRLSKLLLLGHVLTWPAGFAAAQFPEWAVRCSASFVLQGAQSMDCLDGKKGTYAYQARQELRATHAWLRSLGFQEPTVWDSAGVSFAFIDDVFWSGNPEKLVSEGGMYWNGFVVVSTPSLFLGSAVAVHEIFHGVQAASAPVRFHRGRDSDMWIWEGTARAVDMAWAAKPGARTRSFWNSSRDRKLYNRPLHMIIPKASAGTAYRADAYGTAPFWLDVGRQLRATDWVGYLPTVLAEVDRSPTSLEGVDVALKTLFQSRGGEPGGLYRAYPEFVRFRLQDPDSAGSWFQHVETVDVSLDDRPSVVETIQSTVAPIATNAFLIRVRVPPEEMAGLRIEIPGDATNLHLIVDDQRLNRAPDEGNPNRRRNVFSTTVSGSAETTDFWVRVANVKEDAGTTGFARLTLRTTLSRSSATVAAGGAESTGISEGTLFTYANPGRSGTMTAQSSGEAILDRFADHAGLSEDTEEGRQARETIRKAMEEALGTPPGEPPSTPAVTEPAECIAFITLFDDAKRALVHLIWEGPGPFLGSAHAVRATYGVDIADAVYSETKSLGHLAIIEDPERLARWGRDLRQLTIPGAIAAGMQAYRESGDAGLLDFVDAIRGLGRELDAIHSVDPIDGDAPAPRTGQRDLGRTYDRSGRGALFIEESEGEIVEGRFAAQAERHVEGEPPRIVSFSGSFTAVPGPIVGDYLWNGCETLSRDPEDNGDIVPTPAIYPPDDEEDDPPDPPDLPFVPVVPIPFVPIPPFVFIPVLPWWMSIPVGIPPIVCALNPALCLPWVLQEQPGELDLGDRRPELPESPTIGPGPPPDRPEDPTPPEEPPESPPEPERPGPDQPEAPATQEDPDPPGEDEGQAEEDPGGLGGPPAEEDLPQAPLPAEGAEAESPDGGTGAGPRESALVLDFVEAGSRADLQSEPQPVTGRAGTGSAFISAAAFTLDLAPASAMLQSCRLPREVAAILAAGVWGDLRLDVADQGERLRLELLTTRGMLAVGVGSSGSVESRTLPDGTMRFDVAGAWIELRGLRATDVTLSCRDRLAFSFTVRGGGP